VEQNGNGHRPKLVFFYSERSGRSRRAEGFLAQVLQRRHNHETFHLYRVEVAEHPDVAERFGVGTVPALMLVVDNKVGGRLEALRGCREIESFLEPWLN
jgi:thioredoxin-like negative regulator of GroEL